MVKVCTFQLGILVQNERLKGLVHKNTSNQKMCVCFAVVICDAKHFDNLQIRMVFRVFCKYREYQTVQLVKYSE